MTNIGEILELANYVDAGVKNKQINETFVQQPTLRGIVVVSQDKPIGHIPRAHFYQKIGTLYGYNLYMGRANHLLAKTNSLIVDYFQSITEVSTLAMARNEEDLYDDILVTKEEKFVGIVSVRSLLLKLAETQVEMASFLNPLSKLPGNHLIDEQIEKMIQEPRYSFMYFDLDRFKAYNDLYGFNRGDKVLLYLTHILKKHMTHADYFLGHVGGDDFVAIVPHYDVDKLCERIIDEFDADIAQFYEEQHLKNRIYVKNLEGKQEPLTVMTLSIAIVTNENTVFESAELLSDIVAKVKRNCKEIKQNCYLINLEKTAL